MTPSEHYENLFAHELVQILAAHGVQLEQLANLVDIEPAVIERLQSSLQDPTFFPVLSADEMESMVEALLINSTEQARLMAALLATAMKRLLKNQLGQDFARQITDQIYPLLLTASLQTDLGVLGGRDRAQDHDASEDVEADTSWRAIWEAMDAADLALQLSSGLSYTEKVRKLQEARSLLEEALATLESLNKAIKSLPIWSTWHQRASKEHRAVLKRLRALGEQPDR